MQNELFLEIGCEEIPARFLEKALDDLEKLVLAFLDENDLTHGPARTAGTPRRLALTVENVLARQPDKIIERTGPSVKAAYGADGKPTKAAEGFAKGQGLTVADLQTIATDKGEYIFIKKHVPGLDTSVLLSQNLPGIILSLPWPKSMKWADLEHRFVRPVHWIVALFDRRVIPFELFGLTSGNKTRGHRFMAPQALEVTGFDQYVEALHGSSVITSIEDRRRIVSGELARIGKENNCAVVEDRWLVNHVSNLVEFPVALSGVFDKAYLELPPEVLITSMRDHQKYFVVQDAEGNLLPRFVTISNMLAPDPGVVIKGNQRVLTARLEDARFYFREDLKKPLAEMAAGLGGVVFQADLGTYAEKTGRISDLAVHFARILAPGKTDLVLTAASIAKADLVSGVVGQFPELQGIMGMHYARRQNQPDEVAEAIREHYLPKGQGAELPKTETGALVALADKLDTICGCFGVGLQPTGSGDPFALRRAALGVIHILEAFDWHISLPEAVSLALDGVMHKILAAQKQLENEGDKVRAALHKQIVEFFNGRLSNLLKGDKLAARVVDAVLCVRFDDLVEVKKRAEAVARFAQGEDFEPFAVAFKRAANILATAEDDFAKAEIDPDLFDHPAEQALLTAVEGIEAKVSALVGRGDPLTALSTIASIRPQVDDYFDGPLVMHEDAKVRINRLATLNRVGKLFADIADFKKL